MTELVTRDAPEVKEMLIAMADAENRSYTEIFEEAIRSRNDAMRGRKR
jgi:hypothetical protein